MPFKPNYNMERSDRDRAKAMKKKEKLQRREEESAKRKAARDVGVSDLSDKPDGGN